MSQLRQLRVVYAGGALTWFLCLLPAVGRDDGPARQAVLLGLFAAFLVLLLWSTRCLRKAGDAPLRGAGRGHGGHAGRAVPAEPAAGTVRTRGAGRPTSGPRA